MTRSPRHSRSTTQRTSRRCETGRSTAAPRDGITPLIWSPLAGGRIVTGDGIPGPLVNLLDELAHREGVSRAAVAVAFTLAHPTRPVPIVGSQRREHLRALTAALRVHLDRSDCYRIVAASEGEPLP